MRAKTSRPLPDNRFQVQSTFDIHGYHIPSRTPQGKVNYLQMLDILKKYSESKGEYDARDISKDYKVDPVKIQNVVKYFQVLQVFLPPSQSRAGPLLSRERLGTSDRVPDQTEQPNSQGKITWGSSVLRDCFCLCMWSGLCRIGKWALQKQVFIMILIFNENALNVNFVSLMWCIWFCNAFICWRILLKCNGYERHELYSFNVISPEKK